jgi:glutamine synthetase
MANPYLAFAAMLMAGLDGIKNKLDPGSAMDKDLYDLPKEELKQIPTVCGSLREALEISTRTAPSSRTAACSTTTSSTASSS